MTKTFEIYYGDLSKQAQQEFDERFGKPKDFNHDICPLAIYESEVNEDGIPIDIDGNPIN